MSDLSWKGMEMPLLCQMVEEWPVKIFSISKSVVIKTVTSTICKDIQPIRFPNLKNIFLLNNGIDSVEGLNRMAVPLLEMLVLSINDLAQVHDLMKVHLSRLKTLLLRNFMIIKMAKVSSMHRNSCWAVSIWTPSFGDKHRSKRTRL